MPGPKVPVRLPVALTIGGSDPSGGAGIQADLNTFHQLEVYGTTAITLITAQNTQGVRRIQLLPADLVGHQIEAVLQDMPPVAIKLGALGDAAIMETVAAALAGWNGPTIVDPVMVSKHGHPLIDEDAIETFKQRILPIAQIVTPNAFEAAVLGEQDSIADFDQAVAAAHRIMDFGPPLVLVKTRLEEAACDLFVTAESVTEISADLVPQGGNHGSGCVLSAAITALRAREAERDFSEICQMAKSLVNSGIRYSMRVGQGIHPVNTFIPV